MYRLYTNPKEKSGHIHKELQGHFSEHLGRCIYEGIYVGENSPCLLYTSDAADE